MKRSIVTGASRFLAILPFAQGLTGQPADPKLMTAAAIASHPSVRRFAPGLSALVTVGVAALAIASFVKQKKRGKLPLTGNANLERSSAT